MSLLKLSPDTFGVVCSFLTVRQLAQHSVLSRVASALFRSCRVWSEASIDAASLPCLASDSANRARGCLKTISESRDEEVEEWLWVLTQLPALEVCDAVLAVTTTSPWLTSALRTRRLMRLKRMHFHLYPTRAAGATLTSAATLLFRLAPNLRQLSMSDLSMTPELAEPLCLGAQALEELHVNSLRLDGPVPTEGAVKTFHCRFLRLRLLVCELTLVDSAVDNHNLPALEKLTLGRQADTVSHLRRYSPTLWKLTLHTASPFPSVGEPMRGVSRLRFLCLNTSALNTFIVLSCLSMLTTLHLNLYFDRSRQARGPTIAELIGQHHRLQHLRLAGDVCEVDTVVNGLLHCEPPPEFQLVSLALVATPNTNGRVLKLLRSNMCLETLERFEVMYREDEKGSDEEVYEEPEHVESTIKCLQHVVVEISQWCQSTVAHLASLRDLAALLPPLVSFSLYRPPRGENIDLSTIVSSRCLVHQKHIRMYQSKPSEHLDWLDSRRCSECHHIPSIAPAVPRVERVDRIGEMNEVDELQMDDFVSVGDTADFTELTAD